jgi:hypothetical protein
VVFRRFENARFPQENEKNNRATLISHKLISVALRKLQSQFQNNGFEIGSPLRKSTGGGSGTVSPAGGRW